MWLAGASPTITTASAGCTPCATSAAVSRATPARTSFATAVPSMSRAPSATSARAPSGVSVLACKVHRPRLADHHDLDLPGILQLALDAPRDLLAERRRAQVVD